MSEATCSAGFVRALLDYAVSRGAERQALLHATLRKIQHDQPNPPQA